MSGLILPHTPGLYVPNVAALHARSFASLLLHMDGTDASTTFTDSGNTGHTVTPVGNAQIDTAQSVFGGASGLFDGTGDYLTVPDHADWDFGTGDFTVDLRVRRNGNHAGLYLISTYNGTDAGWNLGFRFGPDDNKIGFSDGVANNLFGEVVLADLTWTHVAVTRASGTIRLFIDGTLDVSADWSAVSVNGSAIAMAIASVRSDTPGSYFSGHIDELRIVKGIAHWTANFTPPANAYS